MTTKQRQALAERPKVDRFEKAPKGKEPGTIDANGGRYEAGLITGVSLCSRGEALGHRMWIDSEFIKSIEGAAVVNDKLLKSRFTHPGWCSDGMGKALGTIENVQADGDQVYGDLHFYQTAHKSPDGDLAAYVMGLAAEDPTNFGLSIVFAHDDDAEDEFYEAHTVDVELKDDKGNVVSKRREFRSPDPLNVENYMHCRLAELHAADVVDDPAANPKGLFHRANPALDRGKQLADFLFGRAEAPNQDVLTSLGVGIHVDRVKEFFEKYLADNGLSVVSKDDGQDGHATEDQMANAKDDEKEDDKKEEKKEAPKSDPSNPDPAKEGTDDSADDSGDANGKEKCDDEDGDDAASSTSSNADLAKFCEAFGHEAGAKYFLKGVIFEAAQTEHIKALNAQLKEANEKLQAFAKSGAKPVGFTPAEDKERDKQKSSMSSADEPVDNREKFAALNK